MAESLDWRCWRSVGVHGKMLHFTPTYVQPLAQISGRLFVRVNKVPIYQTCRHILLVQFQCLEFYNGTKCHKSRQFLNCSSSAGSESTLWSNNCTITLLDNSWIHFQCCGCMFFMEKVTKLLFHIFLSVIKSETLTLLLAITFST